MKHPAEPSMGDLERLHKANTLFDEAFRDLCGCRLQKDESWRQLEAIEQRIGELKQTRTDAEKEHMRLVEEHRAAFQTAVKARLKMKEAM